MDLASIAAWCKEHKLRTIGGVWLGGVAGAFAWNSTRTHLSAAARVFHTRIYAQALTLGCLIGSAAAELYDAKYGAGGAGAGGEEVDPYLYKPSERARGGRGAAGRGGARQQ
jgi:hypothetical protein